MAEPFDRIVQRTRWLHVAGEDDMLATIEDDDHPVARFDPFSPNVGQDMSMFEWCVLSVLRVHFSEGEGNAADLSVVLDSRRGPRFDATLFQFSQVGPRDINWRIPADELQHWIFYPGDILGLNWTDPESTTPYQWGVDVAFIYPESIVPVATGIARPRG